MAYVVLCVPSLCAMLTKDWLFPKSLFCIRAMLTFINKIPTQNLEEKQRKCKSKFIFHNGVASPVTDGQQKRETLAVNHADGCSKLMP